MRFNRLAILLGGQDGLAVTVLKRNGRVGVGEAQPEGYALESRASGEGEQGKRQEKLAHD
jgi:hypothetical protein